MTIRNGYEVASEGAVRHWEFPYSAPSIRLSNAAPTPTQPAMVLSAVPGTNITGTVLVTDPNSTPNIAVVDVTHGMVYRHNIRNVTTYAMGAESVWAAINEGDTVYYDDSGTMPADYFLSLAANDVGGVPNPVFGHVVAANEAERALFPLGGAVAASLPNVSVMQEGA